MITDFFGRLHPLVVHLPIGIYTLLFILEYLAPKKLKGKRDVISFMLLCGLFFSIVSLIFGWLLSSSGDYTEEAVFLHKWIAVIFVLSGGGLFFVHVGLKNFSFSKKLYHSVFALVMFLMVATGHLGGNLTHGEDYLLIKKNETKQSKNSPDSLKAQLVNSSSAYVFGSLVQPVLEENCNQCHNAKKKKGGFRMDEFDLLLKGGKNGKSIQPGNAEKSELIKRMLLPIDDDKHMPPKGKPQLTDKEIALVHWWVNHGATRSIKLQDYAENDTLKVFFAASKRVMPKDTLPVVSNPDSAVLISLKKVGFTVNPIVSGSGLLHVSAINMTTLAEEDLKLLAPVAKNIYWLELSNKNISDKILAYLAPCSNLHRLDLKNTDVTGRISSDLNKLSALEYLNLVGTNFDDQGLNEIKNLKGLRQVYCWDTKVTKVGVEQFMKENERVKINLGANQ